MRWRQFLVNFQLHDHLPFRLLGEDDTDLEDSRTCVPALITTAQMISFLMTFVYEKVHFCAKISEALLYTRV